MKRTGIHKPTIEDMIELSGVEMLHPGGFLLTKRVAEVAGLTSKMNVLDVSSGRGTQAIYYHKKFGAKITGIDISDDMVNTAKRNARQSNANVLFKKGDSQNLDFQDNTFDLVINECAVGIPDDPQSVLNEMVRVTKPGGTVVIHESIWKKSLPLKERQTLAERYGTTPFEIEEWELMLSKAGVHHLYKEYEKWSQPEMFWKIRKDRDVTSFFRILTLSERLSTIKRIFSALGIRGLLKGLQNESKFQKAILDEKIGYALFVGKKPRQAVPE